VSWAANGSVRLWYETTGDPGNPVLLLVSGLGSQYLSYRDGWCDLFAAEGFHVVRFDHRDAGWSTTFDHHVPDPAAVIRARAEGRPPVVPYTLSDMAADAIAVLDALGARRAHVMGVSMGAQIAQVLAIEHPDRLLSVVSAMSRTGDPDVGQPSPEAKKLEARPDPVNRDEAIAAYQAGLEVWGSPEWYDPDRAAEWAGEAFDRNFNPAGRQRQRMAIIAAPSRTAALGAVRIPALVIHGTADRLIDPSGGRRTAEAIPGARLEMIEGMGHDYPPELWPRLTALVVAHARAAEATHAGAAEATHAGAAEATHARAAGSTRVTAPRAGGSC
jgi:pimeloyl-ACP methyl ester carboxylesterase